MPVKQPNESGVMTKVLAAASGLGTIGVGLPINLLGIFVPGALTAQVVQLWTQTAGNITGLPVVGTFTLAANAFYRIPGYFPMGLVYYVTNEIPNLTFFWCPAD